MGGDCTKMSKEAFTIRLKPDERAKVETMLDHVAKTEGLTGQRMRAESLAKAADIILIGRPVDDEENGEARAILHVCDYLIQDTFGGYQCLKKMNTTHKPIPLGNDRGLVLIYCDRCAKAKQEAEELRIKKLQEKRNIQQFTQLYKVLAKTIDHGLDVNAYLCKAGLYRGDIRFSQDGETLQCWIEDEDKTPEVSIEDVCMCRINPDHTTPCRFLVDIIHHVKIEDTSIYEPIAESLPELENDAGRRPATSKIIDKKEDDNP